MSGRHMLKLLSTEGDRVIFLDDDKNTILENNIEFFAGERPEPSDSLFLEVFGSDIYGKERSTLRDFWGFDLCNNSFIFGELQVFGFSLPK